VHRPSAAPPVRSTVASAAGGASTPPTGGEARRDPLTDDSLESGSPRLQRGDPLRAERRVGRTDAPLPRAVELPGIYRGLPVIFPKAHLSTSMLISSGVPAGTLTATGIKPRPQQVPGKYACAISRPVFLLRKVNCGDFPIGFHPMYSSPCLP